MERVRDRKTEVEADREGNRWREGRNSANEWKESEQVRVSEAERGKGRDSGMRE